MVLVSLYLLYLFVLYNESQKHKEANSKEIEKAYREVKNKKISYLTILYSLVLIYT